MKSFGLHELQALVDTNPSSIASQRLIDGIAERIRQILGDGSSGAKLFDLPPLVRHFLLRERYRHGGNPKLRIPNATGWPSESVWESHGCTVDRAASEFLLAPEDWTPEWLEEGNFPVFAGAFSDTSVRVEESCEADPFISAATGFRSYSCPGQREAVRAAFLMRPGDTLIVNLPTGSGKSLAGHAPALAGHRGDQLTVFVVPTVALAIDQERQFQAALQKQGVAIHPLAWHGTTSREDRQGITKRLRNASQRILFVSPEALLGSLLPIITDCAKAGYLSHLVIDEAHLVSQWGDGFRPAFQALSGVRNSVIRTALKEHVPRTILLSATFTQESIDTLSTLFGPEDRVQIIAAVHLRPEPQYWSYRASSADEKRERVMEALRHAPRPFILYVTTRREAKTWLSWLHEAGMRRVARFDGEISGQRESNELILRLWADNCLDGVVATSAFGVGIDKSDVRSIIHATIPETLDRFYQEVGRGGRDGCPSVSLLVYAPSDWQLPKKLASRQIISEELGLGRWQAMFGGGQDTEDGLRQIDLRAIRVGLPGDNDYNNAWNLRTLLLLCRAGFIELDIRPQQITDDEEVADYYAPISKIYVRIKDYSHMDAATWTTKIKPIREQSILAGVRSLELLKKILDRTTEISSVLSTLYTVRAKHMDIRVVEVCGGCPFHREARQGLVKYRLPVPTPLFRVAAVDRGNWIASFPHLRGALIYVFYDGSLKDNESKLLAVVTWLVQSAIVREVATSYSSALAQNRRWRDLYLQTVDGVLIHREVGDGTEEPYSPLGRLTVFDRSPEGDALAIASHLVRPFHLVLLPAQTKDPSNGLRPLIDTTLIGMRLPDMYARITQ